MTLTEQTRFMEFFHSGCLAIIKTKNPDYAPNGIPLLDLMSAAVDMEMTIPQALWSLYRKHFSAIRKHFILEEPLTSETAVGRLQDAANYFGFLAFYDAHKRQLHAAWRRYWEKQRCDCVYEVRKKIETDLCEKCRSLSWLDKAAFKIGSARTLSRSTRKGRG